VTLDLTFREASARVIGALASRFRNLDIAEDAFAEACARAAQAWPRGGAPRDEAAWLYRTAFRAALDHIRRIKTAERLAPEPPSVGPNAEDLMLDEARQIPEERLRLIFVCCHPAVAPEARAALTLKLVCGLSTAEIARAFLVPEPTLAQRIVRAKRKIAEAGVPFEIPGPEAWSERLDAVLSTLEIAYSKAHEDAALAGPYAGFAQEMLTVTRVLAELAPLESEAHALAAIVRYAEARRPARLAEDGAMTPLSKQDPCRWNRALIEEAEACLLRAADLNPAGPRALQGAIQSAWCARRSLADPAPWSIVLALYDAILRLRDDSVVRINRAVALAEVVGAESALNEIQALDARALAEFPPFHAVRADLLRRLGRTEDARAAYLRVLALDPAPAERLWLEQQVRTLLPSS